jgi:hypothetical protein
MDALSFLLPSEKIAQVVYIIIFKRDSNESIMCVMPPSEPLLNVVRCVDECAAQRSCRCLSEQEAALAALVITSCRLKLILDGLRPRRFVLVFFSLPPSSSDSDPCSMYQPPQQPYPGPTPAYGHTYAPTPTYPPQGDVKNPYENGRFQPKKKLNDPIFLVLFVLQVGHAFLLFARERDIEQET